MVAGRFTGVAHELVKNLVLKGVARIVLLCMQPEEQKIPAEGLLFASSEGAAENGKVAKEVASAAGALNPAVELCVASVAHVADAPSVVRDTSMVFLVNEASLETAVALDAICREEAVPFAWILTGGFEAMLINDFGARHEYREERRVLSGEGTSTTETEERSIAFCSLRSLWDTHKEPAEAAAGGRKTRSRASPAARSAVFREQQAAVEAGAPFGGTRADVAPLNAIVGGVGAQEAIKAMTGRDLPIHNVVLFDGRRLEASVVSVECAAQDAPPP